MRVMMYPQMGKAVLIKGSASLMVAVVFDLKYITQVRI